MAYILNWSDSSKPTITVQDGTADTTSTSLTLQGRDSAVWGEALQENLMHITENFAGPTAPAHQTIGQVWYDTTAHAVKVWNGTAWDTLLIAV